MDERKRRKSRTDNNQVIYFDKNNSKNDIKRRQNLSANSRRRSRSSLNKSNVESIPSKRISSNSGPASQQGGRRSSRSTDNTNYRYAQERAGRARANQAQSRQGNTTASRQTKNRMQGSAPAQRQRRSHSSNANSTMPRKKVRAPQRQPMIKNSDGETYIKPFTKLPPVYLRCNHDAAGKSRSYKKTSRHGHNTGMLVIAAVFAVFVLIYIGGYTLKMLNTDPVAYETIEIGTVESAKKVEGIIIRSEKVFNAPSSGAVTYAVAENEKIRAGEDVCSISNAQTVAKLQENLDSINEDIMKQQQNREDISQHTEEVKKLETQIKNLSDSHTFSFATGDFSNIYDLRYSVESKLNTRNQLLLNESGGSLETLSNQRKSELAQINSNTKKITSDVGGIVSYSVDGLESTLTPEVSSSLTKAQISQNAQASSYKTNVAANDPVFKVVTSNEWYIAAYLPDSYTDGWLVNSAMTIYLPNGVEENREVEVTLALLNHGEKEAYAVFKATEYMADYMDMRNITFEIDKPKEGYKIPDTSISQKTLLKIPSSYVNKENSSVVKVTEGGSKSLSVIISGEEDSYVLVPVQIGYLSPGDTIKNGEDTLKLEEVVTVNGVFLVNSGITKFVKINTENSASAGGYTVLDKESNPYLHVHDRVVQNVANVQENQNIYE